MASCPQSTYIYPHSLVLPSPWLTKLCFVVPLINAETHAQSEHWEWVTMSATMKYLYSLSPRSGYRKYCERRVERTEKQENSIVMWNISWIRYTCSTHEPPPVHYLQNEPFKLASLMGRVAQKAGTPGFCQLTAVGAEIVIFFGNVATDRWSILYWMVSTPMHRLAGLSRVYNGEGGMVGECRQEALKDSSEGWTWSTYLY